MKISKSKSCNRPLKTPPNTNKKEKQTAYFGRKFRLTTSESISCRTFRRLQAAHVQQLAEQTHKATDLKDRYVSRTELNRVYRWYASTESILPTSRWHMALNLRTMTSKKKDHHLQKNASTLAAAALTGPGGFFEMPSKCLNAPAARPSPSSRLPRTVGKGCTTSETETGSIQESLLQIPNVHRTRTPMQKSEQRAVRTFGPFSKSQETGARR